jgi:hypothetical protein
MKDQAHREVIPTRAATGRQLGFRSMKTPCMGSFSDDPEYALEGGSLKVVLNPRYCTT